MRARVCVSLCHVGLINCDEMNISALFALTYAQKHVGAYICGPLHDLHLQLQLNRRIGPRKQHIRKTNIKFYCLSIINYFCWYNNKYMECLHGFVCIFYTRISSLCSETTPPPGKQSRFVHIICAVQCVCVLYVPAHIIATRQATHIRCTHNTNTNHFVTQQEKKRCTNLIEWITYHFIQTDYSNAQCVINFKWL